MWIRPACIMCNTQYGFLVWMILLNYVDVIAISYNDIPVSQACRIHLLYLKMEKLPLLLCFLELHAFDFFSFSPGNNILMSCLSYFTS